MGITDHIRAVKVPKPKEVYASLKDAKADIKRININTINVWFYPKNSPFFIPTKAILYHYTNITLGVIDQPERLGFLVMDDSIVFDKTNKEEWVVLRQDYPLSLSVNRRLESEINDARKQFPDIKEWYLPTSINKIPVKQIILKYSNDDNEKLKKDIKDIGDSSISKSLIDWIDHLPTEIEVTGSFLLNMVDLDIFKGMHKTKGEGGIVYFLLGGLSFSIVILLFMAYIGS